MSLVLEDLSTEFEYPVRSIHIEFNSKDGDDVRWSIRGLDDYEAWVTLQTMAMTMYVQMDETDQAYADAWFEDEEEDDDE